MHPGCVCIFAVGKFGELFFLSFLKYGLNLTILASNSAFSSGFLPLGGNFNKTVGPIVGCKRNNLCLTLDNNTIYNQTVNVHLMTQKRICE